MEHCVLQSNWYSYLRMAQPTLQPGTCSGMGYGFVSTGQIFDKSEMYWKGGATAFDAFAGPYFKAHPDMKAMLSETRDRNPACKSVATFGGFRLIADAVLGLVIALLLVVVLLFVYRTLRRLHQRRAIDSSMNMYGRLMDQEQLEPSSWPMADFGL